MVSPMFAKYECRISPNAGLMLCVVHGFLDELTILYGVLTDW
jgi:hypothetical protein